MLQTEVWPFDNPFVCCIVMHGETCNARCGVVYSCGFRDRDPVTGELRECGYAVCEKHYRGAITERLLAEAHGKYRTVQERGYAWAVAVVFLFLANAAYTPILKTALMIISCHSAYQCTFRCWGNPDTIFVAAAYFCLVMLGIFGVGLPFAQVYFLRARRRQLEAIFFSPEYGKLYDATVQHKLLTQMSESEIFFGLFTGSAWRPIVYWVKDQMSDRVKQVTQVVQRRMSDDDDKDDENQDEDQASSSSKPNSSSPPPAPPPTVRRSVSRSEWTRFLATDPTVFSVLYSPLELRWIYMSPILLLFKVIIVSQVVFLPSGSIGQRTGMAVVEIVFALLIFTTSPFTSQVANAMYRLSSVHQLALLGLQNLDAVRVADGKSSVVVGMLLVSGVYLLICFAMVTAVLLLPAARRVWNLRESQVLLASFGIQFSGTTSLYVNPLKGRGVQFFANPVPPPPQEEAPAQDGTPVANHAEQKKIMEEEEKESFEVVLPSIGGETSYHEPK
jgi:hypothetical protein